MSQTAITIERVNEVINHPDADRLDIVQVLGYSVVVGRDEFKVGDAATYFPPDILLPEEVSDKLGVTKYLKHAVFPGEESKTPCRVGACRLRGYPSHGFLVKYDGGVERFGADVTSIYGAHKYVPPPRVTGGDCLPEEPLFHQYTEIENIQRYPNAIPKDTPIVVTEKIHGTNCRLGRIDGAYMGGSHKTRRMYLDKARNPTLYWKPFDLVKPLLDSIEGNVIIFGEIFGPKIQDMDYGQPKPEFRAFDISVDGRYMDFYDFRSKCMDHGVPYVPVLYVGNYFDGIEELHTYGWTEVCKDRNSIKSKFKDREGCVIRPITETHSPILGGRLLLKSVSVDYRNRKGATDDE